MKITVKIAAFLAVACAFLFVNGNSSNAQTSVPYSAYDYNTVNLYANMGLITFFEGMTEGDTFYVYLERLNDDGTFHSVLQVQPCIADVTGTCNLTWTGFGNPRAWNQTDQFPMRVRDSFFNALSYHFLASAPVDSWGSIVGDGDEPDKVCIAGCINNPETVNANHHNPALSFPEAFSHFKILTFHEDYALLHYRCDFTTPVADDKIQIRNIDTGAVVFEVLVSELQEYNAPDVNFGTGFSCNNPIVLNVTGETLNFINTAQDDSVTWTLDNPHESSFAPGGYTYARVDAGMADAVIREGMSVWGVTTDPRRENWTVEMRQSQIPVSEQQRVIRRGVDLSLWDSFPEMELQDSLLGTLDPTNYAFFTFRQDFFNVSGIPGAATATWTMEATDLLYGQDVSEYQLIASSSYTVLESSAGLSRQQRLLDAQATYGFDSDAGSLILFLLISILFFFAVALAGVRKPQVYGLGFVALSGIYIGFGFTTTFSGFIIGIAAIAALLGTIVMSRQDAATSR